MSAKSRNVFVSFVFFGSSFDLSILLNMDKVFFGIRSPVLSSKICLFFGNKCQGFILDNLTVSVSSLFLFRNVFFLFIFKFFFFLIKSISCFLINFFSCLLQVFFLSDIQLFFLTYFPILFIYFFSKFGFFFLIVKSFFVFNFPFFCKYICPCL